MVRSGGCGQQIAGDGTGPPRCLLVVTRLPGWPGWPRRVLPCPSGRLVGLPLSLARRPLGPARGAGGGGGDVRGLVAVGREGGGGGVGQGEAQGEGHGGGGHVGHHGQEEVKKEGGAEIWCCEVIKLIGV